LIVSLKEDSIYKCVLIGINYNKYYLKLELVRLVIDRHTQTKSIHTYKKQQDLETTDRKRESY
jgi:chorismate mutase